MAKAASKKPRVAVDPNETKSDKFKRIGGVRVGKAIKAIQNVAALGGKGYESTPAQHQIISKHIRDAHDKMLAALGGTGAGGASKIDL